MEQTTNETKDEKERFKFINKIFKGRFWASWKDHTKKSELIKVKDINKNEQPNENEVKMKKPCRIVNKTN